ncbi:sigma-70 family RNA polymerase sigma factor [Allocoleopsis franciscana]|uniref:RNA polymerase sigma factor, sigma-70 family n=1 Tax=Allocoleopsis franciscana PCC 7113 TaxID=1173027 RepID=K9WCZ8_9CYAN|nr:sigma-70 family RNA polymerase sigma factor [Allocoleopsis franciscana]AFZ17681.1 RNA polymerase sigma factor, sigma-70 family [Allocoleopsis franciscana PCC 7113]
MSGIYSKMMGSGLFYEKPTDLKGIGTPEDCHDLQSDEELIQALKAGQSSALGILYDRYASLVYRLALRILTNPQEAEDLTQEIFLNLWRSGSYNPSRGSLSSFLTTLTRSRAIDKIRSRGSNLKFIQRWSQMMVNETSSLTPFESAALSQRSHQVRQALTQLPEKQRQVLEMAYYEGLSQSEIAAQLGIPLGTIKTWSRQGLLNLRKNLRDFIE